MSLQPSPRPDASAPGPGEGTRRLPEEARDRVQAACARVLERNWREGVRRDGVAFAYTCPSPRHYPWQWFWDSCFTAIAGRRVNPERSLRELGSLLAAQRADGFIGHTIFWNTPLRGPRRFTYNVLTADATMTETIQPPMLAWAWRIAGGDPREVEGIVRHHEWLGAHRDLDGDGLIWIIQPDESGLDASPQFDPVWQREAHGLPGFVRLVRRNRSLGFDLERVARAGGPMVCEVMTNVLYSLSRSALGLPSLTATLLERMYDERRGLFLPLARPGLAGPPPVTWAALSPLALPDLPEQIGHRMVQEHLLDPARFWLSVPPSSVSADEPTFSTHDRRFPGPRRYWRGPTWVNAAWLLWLGLARLGYEAPAAELGRRIAEAVSTAGLREYYNPRTGAGMGAPDFAWSALALELADPDPTALSSYLEP